VYNQCLVDSCSIYIVTNTFSPLILSEYFIVLIPCIRRYLQQFGHGAELLNIRVPSLLVLVELRTTIKVVLVSLFFFIV